ncbi:glycerol transporter [Coemansia sp. RSA 1722]|nr:glycerol transporter [Coemansia sp. RSA 1722]
MAVTTPSSSARPLLPGTTRASQRKMRPPSPSLWRTKEFLLYYLAYITIIPLMIYTMYQTSVPSRKEYHGYEHYLTDGWMLGRKVDLSDGQWRTFRSHLPAFTLAMFAYVAINWCFRLVVLRGFYSGFLKSPMSIRGALPTVWVAFAYASIFVTILSGSSILFILVLTGANYFVAKRFGGRRWAPLVIWAYNVGMLFSNECFKGYEFGRIHGSLAWLDNHRGILRRWDITFNITMLRMVSFAMDYHWRVRQEQVSSLQKIDSMVAGPKTDKDRIEHSCFKEDYCFVNYWAYILYPPLYLTGPIITFNNFISQMRYPPPSIKLRSTVLYGIRLVAAGLFMELILHTVYAIMFELREHEYRKEYEASNRMRMAESGLELELAAAASSAASSQDTLGKSPQVTRDRSDMAVSFGSKAAEADTSNSSGSSPSIHSESLTKRSGGSSGGKRHDHND